MLMKLRMLGEKIHWDTTSVQNGPVKDSMSQLQVAIESGVARQANLDNVGKE